MPGVVDYSWGRPQPFPTSIATAGYLGALRYLCAESSAKRISRGEATALTAAGLAFGLVYEDEAAAPLQGFARGVQNAQRAEQQAAVVGFPADRPIFHAVDFDVTGTQYAALDQYMAGVESVSPRPFGWYGHYNLCERYGATVGYLWQCAAWSGQGSGSGGTMQGRRLSRFACLFQRVGYVLGNTCDLNDVLRDDWGQNNYQGDTDMPLDQADKNFIVDELRNAVRPVVLATPTGAQYLWIGGVPVPTGQVQIDQLAARFGGLVTYNVNDDFAGQMRAGLGCIGSAGPGADAAAIAAAVVEQLGDDLARQVATELASRLAQ